jgi:hypothetical protein
LSFIAGKLEVASVNLAGFPSKGRTGASVLSLRSVLFISVSSVLTFEFDLFEPFDGLDAEQFDRAFARVGISPWPSAILIANRAKNCDLKLVERVTVPTVLDVAFELHGADLALFSVGIGNLLPDSRGAARALLTPKMSGVRVPHHPPHNPLFYMKLSNQGG